jgi:hypothetical protein
MDFRKPLVERSVARLTWQVALLLLVVGAAACSSDSTTEEMPADEAMAEAPAPPSGPRVFFISPTEGAPVKSPVHLMFGAEGFEISAVPEVVETARVGMGHYHVGVDTDCLADGAEIPKADPWVHFGSGASMIDMQLTPGPHKLALQVGDDKHMTVPGLCSVITVNVTE